MPIKIDIKTTYYGYPIEFSFEAESNEQLEALLNDAIETIIKTKKAIEKLSKK